MNHYFPQIFFGSFEEVDFFEEEEFEIEDSFTLLFEPNLMKPAHKKIGLYIDWTNDDS